MINISDKLEPKGHKDSPAKKTESTSETSKEGMIISEAQAQRSALKISPSDFQKEPLTQQPVKEVDNQIFMNFYQLAIYKMEAIFINIISYPKESLLEAHKLSKDLLDNVIKEPQPFLLYVSQNFGGDYLYSHCVNVAILLVILGMSAGFDKDTLNMLSLGGLLHDLGMIKIPREVLLKDSHLTKNELSEVKKHPIYGVDILTDMRADLKKEAYQIILEHHELENGTGYPKGLRSDEISSLAKLAVVVNVYDSLTHPRPYGDRVTPNEALRYLSYSAGILYNKEAIKYLIREVGIYPPGSLVRLDTGEVAEVIAINRQKILRPIVKMITDRENNKLAEPKLVDLSQLLSKHIKAIINPNTFDLK